MAIGTTFATAPPPTTCYNKKMMSYGVAPRSILKDPSHMGASTTAIWKKVCFDDVHIREYGFVLGDNPAVSKGAPLAIDWDYHNEDVIDVDIFEHCREPVRRHRKKIVLSARKRAKILLNAGHTVEEIADMTLQCQTWKRQRVESVKNAGQWDLGNLNVNLADFMSGTAEVTGRTLKLVGFDGLVGAVGASGQAVGKVSLELAKGTGKIVLGTGKVAGDVVVGTGKLGVGIVMGTGKVATDVVVGTGKVGYDVAMGTGKVGMEVVKGTGKVVVGTGKVAQDVVVGTGQFLKTGTEEVARGTGRVLAGTLKGTGRAARRITNIFSPVDLIRAEDLQDSKEHLRHIEPGSVSACASPEQKRKKNRSQRRHTEMNSRSLSPADNRRSRLAAQNSLLASPDEEDMLDELTEMELFMQHLQDMDPEQVRRVLADQTIRAG